MMAGNKIFLIGGAGFIGSHFVDELLSRADVEAVGVFDNFSSGRQWHLAAHARDKRLKIINGDVKDERKLVAAMDGFELVIHLASNPDIARAVTEPAVDFHEGTFLTFRVVEAMRLTSAKRILYTSGSGVYGDRGETEVAEDDGPFVPVSTYGASKLAGEVMIAAYTHMFGLSGCVFRFGNVVGRRQTHGVGFDFLRKLTKDPGRLTILGDGRQSKSYIHVSDVVRAALLANEKTKGPFETYNVATGDYITVTEIAQIACRVLGLDEKAVVFEYTGGNRGWKGDVPIIRLNTNRIRALGWKRSLSSAQAIEQSLHEMLPDLKASCFA